MEHEISESAELAVLTAEIVSAYVANNRIAPSDVPALIASVHSSLRSAGAPAAAAEPEPVALAPAVSIKKSITPDYLICLEDGKQFKSMKRHLATKYGMTPDEYRSKWNLPSDYPMVAANYSAKRSALALSNGLGRKQGQTVKSAVDEKLVRGGKATNKPAKAAKAAKAA